MGFKENSFNKPTYEAKTEEPKKVFVIACEGRNTEPEYFKSIKKKLSSYIPDLVEVDIVPKTDNHSDPISILNNLEQHIEKQYDFKSEHDQMWLICDREKTEDRKRNILKIKPICEEKGYKLGLVNPLFEFWLLLHVTDISSYNNEDLFKNEFETPSKNRRFIDKQLSNILGGFSKKQGKFNLEIVSIDNVKRAVKQEELFSQEIDEVIDNLGANLGSLMKDLIPSIDS